MTHTMMALWRGKAEVMRFAPPGLTAHLAYFDGAVLDAMQPQGGNIRPDPMPLVVDASHTSGAVARAGAAAAGTLPPGWEDRPLLSNPDVTARLLWAEGDVTGCGLRLLCAIAPTAAIGCLFVFG